MSLSQNMIDIAGGVVRNPLVRLSAPVDFILTAGEHPAVVGPNGAGKSLFIDILTGKQLLRTGTIKYDFSPSPDNTIYNNIKYIAFRDSYGAADANYYYQQRWNAHDQDDIPSVKDLLGETNDTELQRELFHLFQIEPLLDKKIIHLSGGELRKFQLTKTLLSAPRVLIMDNPFIGLDAATRDSLHELLQRLTGMPNLQIVLVLSAFREIPPYITHVVPVDKLQVGRKLPREAYLSTFFFDNTTTSSAEQIRRRIIALPYDSVNYTSNEIVKLNKVSIRYGERTILKALDWTVKR
ncbi:ABC transporter ATP-binding protein, partial [termite gut metagenome]